MRDATRITPETIVGFVALSVAASLFAAVAHGQALEDLAVEQQGLNERPAPGTWSVTLGAGLADRPDYPGSSHYQVRPVPLIAIGYGDRVAAGPFGLGFAAIDWKGLRAGPVLGIEAGRRESVDSHLNGLGDTAPVCSPSRAGLMTGRYQNRFGFEYNNGPAQRDLAQGLGLAVGEITLAQLLKSAGYHTGMIGKWHLGSQQQFYPMNRGFDEFVGFLPGETSYMDPKQPGVHSSFGPLGDAAVDSRLATPGNDEDLGNPAARIARTFQRGPLNQKLKCPRLLWPGHRPKPQIVACSIGCNTALFQVPRRIK